MAWEWILLGFTWLGVRKRISLRALIGGRWMNMEQFLRDVLYAAAFWVCALAVLGLGAKLMHLDQAGKIESMRKQLGFLTPGSHLELAVWFCLSATAGFCEEIIFRGYLQRQLAAFGQIDAAWRAAVGCNIWRFTRLRRRRAHAADRNLWIIVWAPRVVAQEPASGNDGARMARRVQRRYFANAEIASVYAAFTQVQC